MSDEEKDSEGEEMEGQQEGDVAGNECNYDDPTRIAGVPWLSEDFVAVNGKDPNFRHGLHYEGRMQICQNQKSGMMSRTFVKSKGRKGTEEWNRNMVIWKIRGDVKSPAVTPETHDIGLMGFDPLPEDGQGERIDLLTNLLVRLWPGDWQLCLAKLNAFLDNREKIFPRRYTLAKPLPIPNVTEWEWWVWWGIFFSAVVHGKGGDSLWEKSNAEDNLDHRVDYSEYMSKSRFHIIWQYIAYVWTKPSKGGSTSDPWWKVARIFTDFNATRENQVAYGSEIVAGQSQSSMIVSPLIQSNCEEEGSVIKNAACSALGVITRLEPYPGKLATQHEEYGTDLGLNGTNLGLNEVTLLRLIKRKRHRDGNDDEENPIHDANATDIRDIPHAEGIVYCNSQYTSVAAAVACRRQERIRRHMVGIVDSLHSQCPKAEVEEIMMIWPAGSHLVLEGEYLGVDLIYMGYKPNENEVTSFLFTKGAGSTVPVRTDNHEQKWKDAEGKPRSRLIPMPDIVRAYCLHANTINEHNQERQIELQLEKHWGRSNVFFRTVRTVIGICLVDAWRLYHHHLPANHKYKKKGKNQLNVKKFISMLAYDCIHNDFEDVREEKLPTEVDGPIAASPDVSAVTMDTTLRGPGSAASNAGTSASVPANRKHVTKQTTKMEGDTSTKTGLRPARRTCRAKQCSPSCSKRTDQQCTHCGKWVCSSCANFGCPGRL